MYPQVKYTAGSLMLSCFSAGGPEHLVQIHGIIYSIKYQQTKNLNLTASVRNIILGRGCIFHQDNNPNLNQHKNGSLSTKLIFYFYPKRLTVHSGYTFFVSMCVPWESNPLSFALLTQCSTTEPQEHHGHPSPLT